MTRRPNSRNTRSAEDRPEGDAPERAQADHGGVLPASEAEAAASGAASATDSSGPHTAREGAQVEGHRPEHPAAGVAAPAAEQAAVSAGAQAPISVPSEDGSGPGGRDFHVYEGLERLALADEAGNALVPAVGVGAGGGQDEVFSWDVTCARAGGLRRVGRHWPQGVVSDVPLTVRDAVLIRADPAFSIALRGVFLAAGD